MPCTECSGGWIYVNGKRQPCPICHGTGTVGPTGKPGGARGGLR